MTNNFAVRVRHADGSYSISASLPLDEIVKSVKGLMPVDHVYEEILYEDGTIDLKKIGSLVLRFVKAKENEENKGQLEGDEDSGEGSGSSERSFSEHDNVGRGERDGGVLPAERKESESSQPSQRVEVRKEVVGGNLAFNPHNIELIKEDQRRRREASSSRPPEPIDLNSLQPGDSVIIGDNGVPVIKRAPPKKKDRNVLSDFLWAGPRKR